MSKVPIPVRKKRPKTRKMNGYDDSPDRNDESPIDSPRSPGQSPHGGKLQHRGQNINTYSLRGQPNTKRCTFFKDGDNAFSGVTLAINPRNYRNLDIVQDELTKKMPSLSYGVRSIYTPRLTHVVEDVTDLQPEGKYVCSSHLVAKGVDLTLASRRMPSWNAGKAVPNQQLNAYLGYGRPIRRAWRPTINGEQKYRGKPKQITFYKNGDPETNCDLLMDRNTHQTFEQIMDDVTEMIGFRVRRIYTLHGRLVYGISGLMHGPTQFVITVRDGERFKPMSSSMSDPGIVSPRLKNPPPKRKAYTGDMVHQHIKNTRQKLSKTRGKWKVWVRTNELPSAGTQSQVNITVYGHKGNSGPLPLGIPKDETFHSGSVDMFDEENNGGKSQPISYAEGKVSVGNIGDIYKIRIAHDNTGDFPGWFCDEVRMQDIHTDEELVFECQRWLSRDEDDCEICRELPAVRDNFPLLPVFNYEVTTATGDLWNASTKANVYITIYGERGDTGVRQLFRSKREDKFTKGQVDVFSLEAVSLGNLRRVIIGHDGTNSGEGWFLERVVIKEAPNSNFEWLFPCEKWLDAGESDSKIVRELMPQEEYRQDISERELWKYEQWKFGSGQEIRLYSKMTQRPLCLRSDGSVDANGEYVDQEGIFRCAVKRDMVRVLQSTSYPKYHLSIDSGKISGQVRHFPSNTRHRHNVGPMLLYQLRRWPDIGRGGAYCEFSIRVQPDRSIQFESTKYTKLHLSVLQDGKVGDPKGTASNPAKQFFVYTKGMFRDKGHIMLCTSMTQSLNIDHDHSLYATGRRNKLAHFIVHKVSEGNIRMFESEVFPGQFIRMKDGAVDCTGSGDKYCHFKVTRMKEKGFVTMESAFNRGLCLGMTTEGRVRPTVDTGDKNVRLYPEVIEFGVPKIAKPPPKSDRKPKKHIRKAATTPPEEDDRIESAQSSFEEGDWKIWIDTADNAYYCQVSMVVYGEHGNSGPIVLGKSGKDLFLSGNQDQFKANLINIGKIFKIRLEVEPTSSSRKPSWKVKLVKLQDLTTKEMLKFKCDALLRSDIEMWHLMSEMPAVRPQQDVLPVHKYQVLVTTGTEPGADTDASVWLQVYGERGDWGKRVLRPSNNKTMFQEGQVDIFEVVAVDLGHLKRAVMGHDGQGSGEGWYCQQVAIRDATDATDEYIFPCNKWFDKGIGDKKIERVLKLNEPAPCPIKFIDDTEDDADIEEVDDAYMASLSSSEDEQIPEKQARPVKKKATPTPPPAEKPKPGEWMVWVTTGNKNNMTTNNQVQLYAYGTKSQAGPIPLGSPKEKSFKKGGTTEFKVKLGSKLGELYKIRIGHDDQDQQSGWFVEKVKMKDLNSGEQFSFKVNQWMWRNEGDCDVWRELPVVRPGESPLPVLTYVVEVYTGTLPGSDTEAVINIQIFGQRGDTGQRVLYHSLNNSTKFQEGQMDEFEIDAVSLDDLLKVIVGHNEPGKGAGWYLDKVIVKESREAGARSFYFPCERWMDEGLDDGRTQRSLHVQDPPKQSSGNYTVWVKTHRDSKPPNDSPAFIALYGDKGCSTDLQLQIQKKHPFQPGATDEFEISAGDIGELYKIRVARKDTDSWQAGGWHLSTVKLRDQDTGEELHFTFNCWLDRSQEDHDIARERPVHKKNDEDEKMQKYEVSVYTGDHWAADCDASLYFTLYGSLGDLGERRLYHSLNQDDKFQRNKVDLFVYEGVSVHDLERLVISHKGKGHGAGWFLDRVVVTEMEGDNSEQEYIFPCGRWLDDHEDNKAVERELRMIDVVTKGEKLKGPAPRSKTQGQWQVEVITSDIHNAGTQANVLLTVYGHKAKSKPNPLRPPKKNPKPFEKGQKSSFSVNVGDIGDIYKIRIEHDNSNNFPAWHLDMVKMTDNDTGEQLKFYADRWLAIDEDDGKICRELVPAGSKIPVLRYQVAVYTSKMNKAETTAQAWLTVYGEQGDSGRLSLAESVTHDVLFLPGQVDLFTMEAVHLGELTELMVEHDGKGKDSAWHVEKIVIKETNHANMEYVFMCNTWIEPRPKQQFASINLPCSAFQPANPLPYDERILIEPDHPTQGTWTMFTTTGTDGKSQTDADVYIVVCGRKSCTDPIRLQDCAPKQNTPETDKPANSNKKSNIRDKGKNTTATKDTLQLFKPGAVDKFQLNVGDVGHIYKIRFHIDQTGKRPAWNMKKLTMKDDVTKQEFHFVHNGWLGRGKNSEDYVLELPAVKPDVPPLKALKYQVSVTTGNLSLADTEATIYCELKGQWGSSGKRLLTTATNNQLKFQRDQTDIFEVAGLDLGNVDSIVIGHNSQGRGKGWFCEKVTLKTEPNAVSEVIFPCHRWLDTGCEDRRLERILHPLAEVNTADNNDADKLPSQGKYKCQVGTAEEEDDNSNNSNNNCHTDGGNTNNSNSNGRPEENYNSNAGPQSQENQSTMSISVYGARGVRRDMFLGSGHGAMDDVELDVGNIGEIYKIRVSDSTANVNSKWMIKDINLQDQHTKEKLSFDFSQWVGQEGVTDCELPAVRHGSDIPSIVEYQVNVHNGGEEEEDYIGEEPEVAVTLHGENGDSGPRRLLQNKQNKPRGQPGEIDTYTFEAVDLGPLDHITLLKSSHDLWELKSVAVKAGQFGPEEFIFENEDSILSTSGETGKPLEVDIPLTRTRVSDVAIPATQCPHLPRSKGRWQVWTTTGEQKDAGTLETVVVVLCGDKQESKPYPLVSEDNDKPFRSGETDQFLLRVKEDTGDIIKVRIGFAPRAKNTKWFLQKINFQDCDTHDEFACEVNDWIKLDAENDGWREVPVLWPGIQPLKIVKYEVSTYTADQHNAGTRAAVSVELRGEHGTTGKRRLKHSSSNKTAFMPGQTDVFSLETAFLYDLKQVWIAQDAKTKGEGWLLNKVAVKEETSDTEYLFECRRWLDSGEDDGAMERVLEVTGAAKPEPEGEDWTVWATTGRDKNSSTKGPIVLVIYGENSKSAELPLGTDGDYPFRVGKTVELQVTSRANLGDVYKVRVGFSDEAVSQPSWKLEKLKLQNLKTGLIYTFDVDRWVEVTNTHDSWVECAVTAEKPEEALTMYPYQVQVYTGDIGAGGTNANVHLTVYGERGDTGKRKLVKPVNHDGSMFECDQMDLFEVEAVDMAQLKKVVVGHDGAGAGSGWFLDKIIIKAHPEASEKYVFPCGRWLDEGEDDGKIERSLKVKEGAPWKVTTITGDEEGASCPGPLTMVLYGDKGQSAPFKAGIEDEFEFGVDGQEDELLVKVDYDNEIEDIGELYKIRLGFNIDDHAEDVMWFLEKLSLRDQIYVRDYEFRLDDWVRLQEDNDSWHELSPVDTETDKSKLPVRRYVVEVYTGDKSGAGTDANVYLQIIGKRGDTGIRKLLRSREPGKKFECGKRDVFEVEAVDMLDLTTLLVGHDGQGVGSGWWLDKIIIRESYDATKAFIFNCDRWLDEGEDDKLIKRWLDVTEVLEEDKEEDWKVWTTTGSDKLASGTESVVLVMYGEKGKTEDVPLKMVPKKTFQKGKTDEFKVRTKAGIGDIFKVRVGFNKKKGSHPSWQLSKVKLQRIKTEEIFEFALNDWVKVTNDHDGWTEIPAHPTNKEEVLQVHKYQVQVFTGEESGGGTDANVFINIYGQRGDTGNRHLIRSINNDKKTFEQGNIDLFEFTAVDMGDLTQVEVSHDGEGIGCGWYLEKIIVKEHEEATRKFVFPCNRWLDEGEEDGSTCRILPVKHGVLWRITTVTGDEEGGAAEGPATVVLYGDKGKSCPTKFGTDPNFEFAKDGPKDEMEITFEYEDDIDDIGELYKIRVGFERDDEEDEVFWDLTEVIAKNMDTGEKYRFVLNDWIKLLEESDSWREIAVYQDEPEDKLPVHKYWVEVYTGDRTGAGTDAHVYIQIIGERGDTGLRKLIRSREIGPKFEMTKKDVFEVEAVDMSKLEKVIVGHDGQGFGSGWFLEKIIISSSENAETKYLFECDRWLDEGEDDGKLERDLALTRILGDEAPEKGDWCLYVVTSEDDNSGTDAQVTVTLFGEKGNSGPLELGKPGVDLFEAGASDQFEIFVDADDVGKFEKCRVEHDELVSGKGWKPDKLVLEDMISGDVVEFPFDCWMDVGQDDGDVVREAGAVWPDEEEPDPPKKYIVETYTAKQSQIGKDPKVYLTLYDKDGDSGKRHLMKNEDGSALFKPSKKDVFSLEAIGLGDLERATIGYSQTDTKSAWFLEKLVVKPADDTSQEVEFTCNAWIGKGKGDKKTERELTAKKEPASKKGGKK